MIIDTAIIISLNPCGDRLSNYLEHYANFSGSMSDFVDLDKISDTDKKWVIVRVFDKKQRVRWAALCAQSVLHIFESKYPDDKRPREAVEFLLSGVDDEEKLNIFRRAAANAADAAADAANAAAADADAADADDAAAYSAAAYDAADAAYAAAHADADDAASYAAYAAASYADADAAYAAAAAYADAAYAAAHAVAYAAAAGAARAADAASYAAAAHAAYAYAAQNQQNKKNFEFAVQVSLEAKND
jgi:hypothetical protein